MRLALRGRRDMDDGAEQITDAHVLHALRLQARRVHVRSVTAALVLTALFIVIS